MGFKKICLKRDPSFLDWRKAIPGLDRFLEFSRLVDDVVGLQYFLRMRIGTMFHVTILEKVFDFVTNVVNWSEGVIVHLCYFFKIIIQLTW